MVDVAVLHLLACRSLRRMLHTQCPAGRFRSFPLDPQDMTTGQCIWRPRWVVPRAQSNLRQAWGRGSPWNSQCPHPRTERTAHQSLPRKPFLPDNPRSGHLCQCETLPFQVKPSTNPKKKRRQFRDYKITIRSTKESGHIRTPWFDQCLACKSQSHIGTLTSMRHCCPHRNKVGRSSRDKCTGPGQVNSLQLTWNDWWNVQGKWLRAPKLMVFFLCESDRDDRCIEYIRIYPNHMIPKRSQE